MKRKAISPGKVLREEFMRPYHLHYKTLALQMGVDCASLSDVLHARVPITPEMARMLARRFNTTEGFWLVLQARYDQETHGR